MFEVASEFLIVLIEWIPGIIAIYVLFDLIGGLLFDKR